MAPATELTDQLAATALRPRTDDTDGIGCQHPGVVLAASRNASSVFITTTIDIPVLQALLDGTADTWQP
jgi:hypothetical protein